MRENIKIAVIGGSGFYTLLEDHEGVIVNTPFGKTPQIEIGWVENTKVAFLPRHAEPGSSKIDHKVPPHLVNYRANIYGLKKLGVDRILAVNSCGVINRNIQLGDFVLIHQFIDLTKQRASTFYDGKTPIKVNKKLTINKVVHVDLTEPFCPEIKEIAAKELKTRNIRYHTRGVYVCTEGPRFETPAEIKAFQKLGGDLVGMTVCPEVILARELAVCYVSFSIATNWAAGIGTNKITLKEVLDLLEEKGEILKDVLKNVIPKIPKKRSCPCKDALDEYS
ncbi:MAG: MTAP family purine nucleoside phosphorylase [Candidatus Odinarchaeia archaeon]